MLVWTHLKSLSDKVSGDSIAIFIRCERLISPTTYTRMRAPFINKDGLYFEISREGFFSTIGKLYTLGAINGRLYEFDPSNVSGAVDKGGVLSVNIPAGLTAHQDALIVADSLGLIRITDVDDLSTATRFAEIEGTKTGV